MLVQLLLLLVVVRLLMLLLVLVPTLVPMQHEMRGTVAFCVSWPTYFRPHAHSGNDSAVASGHQQA